MLAFVRWLWRNLGALLTAVALAVVVWVSAVINADPNVTKPLDRALTIEFVGQNPNLKIIGDYTAQVRLTLEAPNSLWEKLNADSSTIRAWVDLAALQPGEHTLPVQVDIGSDLARLVRQDPAEITLRLEAILTQSFPVTLVSSGEPPLGYQAQAAQLDPAEITLSGPASLVNRVKEVRAAIDLAGATQTLTRTLSLNPVDAAGKAVTGISLLPNSVHLVQKIALLGGYRNVIVKLVTQGLVANGYRLTNYYVSPTSVVVFSKDPRLVDALPGYVETKPLDLTGASDYIESLLELNLPPGVTAVTDSKVTVQVSIAAIESSLSISLPIEITGLAPTMLASIAPSTIDLIVSGPVPILNDLKPSDVRVKVDLSGFQAGTYQVIPVVDFLPPRLQKVSILPTTVEVTISLLPTSTPTPTLPPGSAGRTATPSPAPSITPTKKP